MAAEEPGITRPVDPDDIGLMRSSMAPTSWGTSRRRWRRYRAGRRSVRYRDRRCRRRRVTSRYADAAHQHALAAPAAPAALGGSAATGDGASAIADHVHPTHRYAGWSATGADTSTPALRWAQPQQR